MFGTVFRKPFRQVTGKARTAVLEAFQFSGMPFQVQRSVER